MVNVPVLAGGGTHIFDRAAAEGAEVTPQWKAERFKEITQACSEHHGAVFARYLTALCKEPTQVRVRSERYIAEFVAKVGSSEDGDTARDIANKFGLIYAGGRLAIRYKLVSWKRSELRAAIYACYRAARDSLPDEGVILRQGAARLEKFLTSLKNRSEIFSFDKLPGYRVTRTNSQRYLVRTEVFNDVFETRAQRDLVESLIRTKRIATSRPKGRQTLIGPKEQFKWPDGKRRRSYQITIPKPSKA